MSAKAQAEGIRPHAYNVVVEWPEKDHKSVTIGPYRALSKAEEDVKKWDNKDGKMAWVEPVYSPEDYEKGKL